MFLAMYACAMLPRCVRCVSVFGGVWRMEGCLELVGDALALEQKQAQQ